MPVRQRRCGATVQTLLIVCLLARCQAVCAAAERTQVPALFHHSYFGLSAGYADFGFTNAQLTPPLHATSIQTERASLKVYGGHYFTPYLALQLSLMRPIQWVKYTGVYAPQSAHSVWPNIVSLTVRPTWPVHEAVMLYSELGASYLARTGFHGPDGAPGVQSAGLVTPLTGAGLVYRVTPQWHLDASVNVAWPNHHAHQPSTRYAGLGFSYFVQPSVPAATPAKTAPDAFPLQGLEWGFFDRRWVNWDPTKRLAHAYVPLFFQGDIKAQSGYYLMYERNVYHTKRWLSLDWGVSAGGFRSALHHDQFATVALFPALRVWPVRRAWIDGYVTASLAGPAYLSRQVIDGMATGGHFTFQDYVGVGAVVGQSKHLQVNLKLLHYSNGNLRSHNPGIATPFILNMGYTW